MKIKTVVLTAVLAVFAVIVLGFTSQKLTAQGNSAGTSTTSSTMSNWMGHGGMMGNGMMGQAMMGRHNATQKLINQLTADLSAAKADATSTAVKSKLADASSIIAHLRSEMPQWWGRMGAMTNDMQYCPAIQTQQH